MKPTLRLSGPDNWLAPLMRGLLLMLVTLTAAQAQDGAQLRERHVGMTEQLNASVFKRPLLLESTQSTNDLKGDVYAVVDHPFATVAQALKGMGHWCDILILHLNVKHCRATNGPPADILSVSLGRKVDQALDETHRVDFAYRVVATSADYLQVQLTADSGPMSTRNYRIQVQATPLDGKRSFLHMSYSYAYGMAARLATQAYLSTAGSGKVGFSVIERRPDGQPVYVGGVRGVVERNTMRYFLCIEAYLGALSAPATEQVDRRLRNWHAATERYALQLRELDLNEYLDTKQKEVGRQKSAGS